MNSGKRGLQKNIQENLPPEGPPHAGLGAYQYDIKENRQKQDAKK
jgi:hypothetical protein